MESKVDETLRDSSGSLRKTNVRPFCFEKTRMINADSLISDKVIDSGIVNPAAAAKGCGDVKLGLAERYVFNGFACGVPILAADMIHERFPVGEYKKHLNAQPPCISFWMFMQ